MAHSYDDCIFMYDEAQVCDQVKSIVTQNKKLVNRMKLCFT